MSWPIAASVAAACLYGLGAVLQSLGARRGVGSGIQGLVAIVRQGPFLAGLACDLVGWLLAMYAVNHLPLFAVHTTLAGSVAVTVVLAWFVLRIPLRGIDGAAIGTVVVGLVLVGLAAGSTPDSGGNTKARIVLVLAVPLAGLLGVAAARSRYPIMAAVVAGLMFSLGATAVRTVEFGRSLMGLLVQPTAWAVPLSLGGGLVVHARSLQKGCVGPVTAALWTTEILVAATAGWVLFGDRVRPGAFWWAMTGMVLALGATIQLAFSPSHTASA